MTQFYLPASGQLLDEANLQVNTGFSPESDPSYLSANGIYTVTPSPDPYDPGLYTTEPSFVIAGNYALESWVATPLPLPTAKDNATVQAKGNSNVQAADLISASGVNVDIWTGAASQLEVDRPPLYNTLLGAMATIGDNLATTLTAIDTSTSVDEINNIINPPTGILNTGRGQGLGPEDLNPSYLRVFSSTTLTPADTELYVPGTSTVIPYDAESLPAPYTFDSLGDCFAPGDYELQLRVAATSAVIATFTIPLAVSVNENLPFTGNPILSSGGGGEGGGSSHAA
jgi:hypothetical protein